jgi:hypothetical protein
MDEIIVEGINMVSGFNNANYLTENDGLPSHLLRHGSLDINILVPLVYHSTIEHDCGSVVDTSGVVHLIEHVDSDGCVVRLGYMDKDVTFMGNIKPKGYNRVNPLKFRFC